MEEEVLPLLFGGIIIVLLFECIVSLILLRKRKAAVVFFLLYGICRAVCVGLLVFLCSKAINPDPALDPSIHIAMVGVTWALGVLFRVCTFAAAGQKPDSRTVPDTDTESYDTETGETGHQPTSPTENDEIPSDPEQFSDGYKETPKNASAPADITHLYKK